jgi:hypothetical protein
VRNVKKPATSVNSKSCRVPNRGKVHGHICC